ncbi:MAG: hypothetical protein ABIZ57_12390 [Candidatus Limnocylindria bacterium]
MSSSGIQVVDDEHREFTFGPRPKVTKSMDPEEHVELGAQVEARTGGTAGANVAVRVPRDLLARISAYASLRGLTISEVLREGAER